MWKYVKSLEYPVNIKKKDLRMAKYLVTQYGGSYINRDFRKEEVMNNYCINLKKRKNKPYCKLLNKEITFSLCRECDNKEYKKSTSNKKSPTISGQMRKNAQSLTKEQQKKIKMHKKTKKLTKLEKNRYSVFSYDTERCYLCGSTYKLTWHEIYAGKNRQNSMRYGLCLRLCLNCHSKEQEDSQFNDYWHKQGQLYWEKNIGSREEFIKVFRRNYLE